MVDLERTANLLAQVTPVRVEPALCVRARSPKATCQACLELCPVEALTLDRRPQIDPDRCTACGLCVAGCPTGAIRLETPTPAQLLAGARKVQQGAPLLICKAEAARLGRTVVGRQVLIPCIGMLTTEVLAGLAAAGHEKVLIWRSAICQGECSYGPVALRQIEQAFAGVEALYPGRIELTGEAERLAQTAGATSGSSRADARSSRAGHPRFGQGAARGDSGSGSSAGSGGGSGSGRGAGSGSDQLDRTLVGEDRRAFLESALRGSGQVLKALLGDWLTPPKPEAPAKVIFDITGLPGRRQVLQAALTAAPPAEGARLPEHSRLAQSNCTLCPICSRLCPSGALRLNEEEGRSSLTWQASRCTECNLCAEVCPSEAMGAGERIGVAQFLAEVPVELVAGQDATCACGNHYWRVQGGPEQCMACRWQANRGPSIN